MKRLLFYLFLIICFSSCMHTGDMDEYRGCGLEGDAKRADIRELNTQKNRYDIPDSNAIDRTVTLAAMLAPGNDINRFTAGRAVEITGYVSDVKIGGYESCNCHASDPQYRDTHIELVAEGSDSGSKQCVIVEVTPRMRNMMATKGIDWSTPSLKNTIQGHYITVRGWLLFDEEHRKQATNTAPRNLADWRATCWEIHPITSITIDNAVPSL